MSNNSRTTVYRWKGKIVNKSVYAKRLAQRASGLQRRKVSNSTENEEKLVTDIQENMEELADIMGGRRIVELKILGQQLWCVACKEVLSLENIEKEIRQGLGSKLLIRCHKCRLLNEVSTGKQHPSLDKRCIRFDINSKAALGALHSGLGWTQIRKFFATMNIPCFDFKTFKKYEEEIGFATESVAKTSCKNAAALESKLTVEQAESIKKPL